VTRPAAAPSRHSVRADAASPYSRTVGEHVRKALELLDAHWQAQGRSLADLGSPEELAGRMLAVVPEPSPWDNQLGPVLTTAGVARLLGGVSRQAVAERRRRRTLLALRTADRELVYPVFQFDRGDVLPGLGEVMASFGGSSVDDWTVAGWLTARHDELGGASVPAWLKAGGSVATAVTVARNAVARMAG
jgi:hypothetical protein